MTSSMRLRNSGLKVRLTSVSTSPPTLESATDCVPAPAKPNVDFACRCRAPMFDVMMMIVFLKSTVLPSPSVSWPSSNTCSRMLNRSGWAFSISSSRMIEYG